LIKYFYFVNAENSKRAKQNKTNQNAKTNVSLNFTDAGLFIIILLLLLLLLLLVLLLLVVVVLLLLVLLLLLLLVVVVVVVVVVVCIYNNYSMSPSWI